MTASTSTARERPVGLGHVPGAGANSTLTLTLPDNRRSVIGPVELGR